MTYRILGEVIDEREDGSFIYKTKEGVILNLDSEIELFEIINEEYESCPK